MKKIIAIVLILSMLFVLPSCDKEQIFRYDMGASPKNLDPQMAHDTASQIILKHTMQGLVKEDENGNIVCDAAQNYEVSNNNTVYTFILKENLKWSNGENVTAKDFEFALKRIFLKETSTPNKASFLCIKNAQSISNGESSVETLGVKAISNRQLVITLSSPNPYFLFALTTTAALPCNEDFFNSTKGKYGYDATQLIFNGPFKVDKSTDKYIQLVANDESYFYSEKKDTIIVLYTSPTNDKQARFLEESTDFSEISISTARNLDQKKFTTYEFENSTWVIGFNQNNELFKNLSLRKAMFSAISDILPNINGYPSFELANGLIVPGIRLQERTYRSMVSDVSIQYEDALTLLTTAYSELSTDNLGKITILCPDNEIFKYYITYIQKAWREKLGVIVNFVAKNEDEYYTTLYNGDFDLAIFPIETTQNTVTSQLEKFLFESKYNYINYNDEVYANLLNQISVSTTFNQIANNAYNAEKYLIDNAVVIPLVFEKKYFASNNTNKNITFSPYGPTVDFTSANKK